MKHGIHNGFLLTDFDANNWRVLNLGIVHIPGFIETDDPRLSDARVPLDGSVTNVTVVLNAGIEQSKLNLDLGCPPSFMVTAPLVPPGPGPHPSLSTRIQAARGDLVQQTAQKNQPNGYAGLGPDKKLLSGSTPLGTGSLVSIDIDLPPSELTVVPSVSGTTRTLTGYWNAQSFTSWFGNSNSAGEAMVPAFNGPNGRLTRHPIGQFPDELIPGFDASRITSETFLLDVLPVAQGVGPSHAAGVVPDPGDSPENPTDYLARDMTYKSMSQFISYQPQVPAPSITFLSWFNGQAYINLTTSVPGANIFYSTQFYLPPQAPFPATPYVEVTTLPLLVPATTNVFAYAAKVGYNNSPIANYYTGFAPGRHPQ